MDVYVVLPKEVEYKEAVTPQKDITLLRVLNPQPG